MWPVESRTPFGTFIAPANVSFADVFERRRSTRALAPTPVDALVGMFHFALTPRYWQQGDGMQRSRRPALSAGALHPISVVILVDSAVYRVNVEACTLDKLAFSAEAYATWLGRCRILLPKANGAFMALIADLGRPKAAYANCESLILRDAGAMLQTLALAAEWFGLGFSPLGILGNEVVAALPASEQLLAVGGAAVGLPIRGN
ncbi:hypothetical protein VOM14_18725 [Paraburkholderia sp. MPAMCS5]|uniref:hypothetical protein n=1 Tax=Paraburkholderia sp. MPAMCS5 TaxID=3112563 RepID=UPI002E17349A|nr:hypothetical protein [Paraburkholderia sp. MPAMCS5]